MKRIETLKCNHPRLFWMSWGTILLWIVAITFCFCFDSFYLGLLLLSAIGYLLLPTSMFLMFCSLDWREVENFAFFLHPGRLRQIGLDYFAMFIILCFLIFVTEWLGCTLTMLSLAKYLYDMIKLVDLRGVVKEK